MAGLADIPKQFVEPAMIGSCQCRIRCIQGMVVLPQIGRLQIHELGSELDEIGDYSPGLPKVLGCKQVYTGKRLTITSGMCSMVLSILLCSGFSTNFTS